MEVSENSSLLLWITIIDNKTSKKATICDRIKKNVSFNGRRGQMLLLKDRVVYQVNKLFIEYNHKGDIDIYTLTIETMTQENINLYAHDSKSVIDFIFDSIVAEINVAPQKIVDVNYIINNAYE